MFVICIRRLTLVKQASPLDIRWSRPLPEGAVPFSVTVTRTTGGRYYVSLLIEEDVQPLPATAQEVGIDLNVKELVLSTGERFQPPKALQRLEQRKRRYQRACRRKVAAARQLVYKAQWSGRTAVQIDRWYPSSQRCGNCGHLHRALRLSDRHWTCPACGTRHDRDLNAACNILAAGKAILQGADALRVHE